MKAFLFLGLTGFILGGMLGYMTSYVHVPKFSEIVSVKTLDGVKYYNFLYQKMLWDKTVKTVCYGNGKCRNYSSSSSRGSSSWGGGK